MSAKLTANIRNNPNCQKKDDCLLEGPEPPKPNDPKSFMSWFRHSLEFPLFLGIRVKIIVDAWSPCALGLIFATPNSIEQRGCQHDQSFTNERQFAGDPSPTRNRA